MSVEPSKESMLHTVHKYWSGKRFLKLFIFALLLGNVTLYCVGMIARKQVVSNAINHHNKIYTAFLQAVERARKTATTQTPEAETGAVGTVSPYWLALRDTRKQFPYYKVNIVLPTTTEGERDKRIMDMVRDRPRGWTVTDEREGWARSFFVLPTKNTAAFQAVSYINDDLNAWETTAIMIGGYAFVLLFAFGWFWTRSLDEGPVQQLGVERDVEIGKKLRAVQGISGEIMVVLDELTAAVTAIEAGTGGLDPRVLAALDEMAAQTRLLAINGSIEAARNSDTYRVFHVIMQEINQLSTQSRELVQALVSETAPVRLTALRERIEQVRGALSVTGAAAGGPADGLRGSSSSSFGRRAG